jgi:hypothetical protein
VTGRARNASRWGRTSPRIVPDDYLEVDLVRFNVD